MTNSYNDDFEGSYTPATDYWSTHNPSAIREPKGEVAYQNESVTIYKNKNVSAWHLLDAQNWA